MVSKSLWFFLRSGFLVVLCIFIIEQATGTSVFVRHGGKIWLPVNSQSPYVSKSVRAALKRPVPEVEAGEYVWHELQKGFYVAELPVLSVVKGEETPAEMDRIFLTRIDPARYRFEIHNDPQGKTTLDEWRSKTGALLVVNGSFYDRTGRPSTPSVVSGRAVGPKEYKATHGAFIDNGSSAHIVDLKGTEWKEELTGAAHAFVSYPLLKSADGTNRVNVKSDWLANRSFIAQDTQGHIVVGTTDEAFFSLTRLAAFLQTAPLDLGPVLNLDGGPVACQSVDIGNYHRAQCGEWEVQVGADGNAKVLPPLFFIAAPRLPIVLTVVPE